MDNQITIIEITADSIYFIIVGDKDSINDLVLSFNNNIADNLKFVSVKIDIPIASKCNELFKESNKCVELDIGIETAQCYTYADGYDNKNYMMVFLETINDKIIMSYPKIPLSEDGDAEQTIFNWLKKKIGKVPKSIKKSIKPITLVGANDEILVFSAKYKQY